MEIAKINGGKQRGLGNHGHLFIEPAKLESSSSSPLIHDYWLLVMNGSIGNYLCCDLEEERSSEEDHVMVFNDLHIALAVARAGDSLGVVRLRPTARVWHACQLVQFI